MDRVNQVRHRTFLLSTVAAAYFSAFMSASARKAINVPPRNEKTRRLIVNHKEDRESFLTESEKVGTELDSGVTKVLKTTYTLSPLSHVSSGKCRRAPYGDGALAYCLWPTFGRVEGRLRPGSAMRLAMGFQRWVPVLAVSNPQVGDCACRKAWPSREHALPLYTQPIKAQLEIHI
jgi:hypothetical protein